MLYLARFAVFFGFELGPVDNTPLLGEKAIPPLSWI
jgi:hypothetical protein